jgi:hypothetical protein
MVIEGGCHSTCITAYHVIEFPLTSGRRRPCRDGGGGEIAPGFAMLIEQNALHTLIHQRHLTPSCGGHAPTAERTLDPARIIGRELDPRPGIREQPRSIITDATGVSRHPYVASCLKADVISRHFERSRMIVILTINRSISKKTFMRRI